MCVSSVFSLPAEKNHPECCGVPEFYFAGQLTRY
ncbi:uncharacterized protein CCOS01_15366 [Colletotrichum costaricense]|uniref:Uncharacterized protein n=1 Tax=Colletotrichum costaricense TaxID=1209916 RepID=A0AAJ0DTU3_9PEZI|nr:uncharacterized protein CCOS01_15366 [Colletotrichum costaricense]KAK1510535.1 hypothetical protein CCOS01_15366 [Colletotrichum costaricense]